MSFRCAFAYKRFNICARAGEAAYGPHASRDSVLNRAPAMFLDELAVPPVQHADQRRRSACDRSGPGRCFDQAHIAVLCSGDDDGDGLAALGSLQLERRFGRPLDFPAVGPPLVGKFGAAGPLSWVCGQVLPTLGVPVTVGVAPTVSPVRGVEKDLRGFRRGRVSGAGAGDLDRDPGAPFLGGRREGAPGGALDRLAAGVPLVGKRRALRPGTAPWR